MFFWKVAELNALKPEDVDSLMKKMIDEVCSCEHLEMMSSSCRERYTVLLVSDGFILQIKAVHAGKRCRCVPESSRIVLTFSLNVIAT